jgi:hypothetical protein
VHTGIGRVVAELASAAAVLAAFWAGVRALAGRAFGRAPRVPGLRVRGGYRRGSWLAFPARLAGRLVVLAARFVAGAPLGTRRTDATFLDAGTKPIGGVPGWFSRGEPGRWAYLPGWQRALVRWSAVAVAVGMYAFPVWTGAALGWLGLLTAGVLFPRWQRWRYVRRVVRPIYLQVCQYLGTDPADSPARWLTVPRTFATDPDAEVRLAYPATWNPDTARQRSIDQLIRRHLGADLVPSFGAFAATWRHPPAPPALAPFEGYDLPAHRVHLATLAGGAKFIANLQDEEPHLFVAAGTGGGKTATVSVPAAHVRAHGWLVDIIDPKRRSYIDRKTGADVLTNVPGIRVHTSIEAMLWALEEFFLSMLGVNIAVGDRTAYPAAFPQRLLVIDEFGTFASMAARMWRREHGTGPAPALDQRRQIEWQGRQAGHRLAVAVHQPNLRLFGDSDSRAQYGYRLLTGAYSTSLWRMTFGHAPRIEWDARIKGRGVAGIGEAENLIHAAQLAWMPAHERRRYALTGPPPPDWFTTMDPAPWIDQRVITEGRKLAGVSLVTVPPGRHVYVPGETPPDVPPGVPVTVPAPRRAAWPGTTPGPAGGPGTDTAPGPDAGHEPDAGPGPDAVIGIPAAARLLGYDKPDSFRRARTRHPIPGEQRLPDGRPWWTPQALRNWHASRKISGNRQPGSGPG